VVSQINSHKLLFLQSFLSLVDCFLRLSTVINCTQVSIYCSLLVPLGYQHTLLLVGLSHLGMPSSPSLWEVLDFLWVWMKVLTTFPPTLCTMLMHALSVLNLSLQVFEGPRWQLGPGHIRLLTDLTWNLNCLKSYHRDCLQVDCRIEIAFSLQEKQFSLHPYPAIGKINITL